MNDKIKQFVAFGVASVVALIVCLGVLVVTVNNLDNDINTSVNKTITNKTELDSSKATLVEYINKLVLKTDDRFVKTKTYTDVNVGELKILNSSENQSNDEALLDFAKDKMLSVVDGFYSEDLQGAFEKDDSKKLALIINENSLKDANFLIGKVNENGESVFDDEGNLVDNEYYYLTYNIDAKRIANDNELSSMLSVKDDLFAKKQFIDAVEDNCKITDFEAKPDNLIIKVKVNRATDEIQYINVIRSYAMTINADFINNAEFFGKKEISFIYTVTDIYEYSYAGISFVEDEVTIGHGDEYMLNVNAIIDDDSEYSVEFESSMDDVVSVDEMGYIKGLKNTDSPTTITVKLNYLGEIFTDTCIVNISEE